MKKILSEETRVFFRRVGESISANPFTPARHRADCRLTGLAEDTDPDIVLKTAIHKVNNRVEALITAQQADLSSCTPMDRPALTNLFLFFLFHKYLPLFDLHIRKQNQTTQSLPLEFGRNLEKEMAAFGFTNKEAGQYISLFFQMRRAFFFIHTGLVGDSPCMEKLRARLWNTLFTHDIGEYAQNLIDKLEDFSTLLVGETGTGKGLAAAAIGRSGFIPYDDKTHRFTPSFTRAFLAINLCQYPEQLIESELFGHARGAFTGAVAEHQGIFARSSSKGAVFLDEIGEISIQTQIKLLRILQERTFSPVGSHTGLRFKGRLIGATNRDLGRMIEQGKFREDFYFRMCTDTISLPSLKKRIIQYPRELGLLANHLIGKIAGKGAKRLRDRVVTVLQRPENRDYEWPGNVRELE
ncbi:MAG TPA: sigma-54-dependent Fis family transcriptional regulator, partial [Desulfobulbaceae bacterium]|nr:sigma-54-dependent Fis family transcriptional regulator [Desulfobulbaceae bacterium]